MVALATACAEGLDDRGGGGDDDSRITARVVEVVDGDTIRVDLNGEETPVRLIGIDTPEKDGPYTDEECYGEQATRYTAEALGGRDVELEFDVERTDRFDRTLAYVWIDDGLFNERILRGGVRGARDVPSQRSLRRPLHRSSAASPRRAGRPLGDMP